MGPLDEVRVTCPYCGAGFVALIDSSLESHQYVEDCRSCCSPIDFHIDYETEDGQMIVRTEQQ